MNKDVFFSLFGKRRPSVKLFYELLEGETPSMQEAYYNFACRLFLNEYYRLPVWYKTFLMNLVKHDFWRFFNYLLATSGFATLRFTLKETAPIMSIWKAIPLIAFFHLLACGMANIKFSFEQLSFFAELMFDIPLKFTTLAKYIREYHFTPETFFELAEYVKIFL